MSWDLVMALAQGFLTVFLLPTVLRSTSYVPRITSSATSVGLAVVSLALYNLGSPMGAAVAFIAALLWAFIFFKRGTEGGSS
ncbi:hypothetical protein LCGC14_2898670 [marine sediment metagenome]|uniref:Uncharacterized protein n=1 Tax=marine sediment metagenome TaxID=412755 RepID=A0A0F9ALA1_9ZZZZ